MRSFLRMYAAWTAASSWFLMGIVLLAAAGLMGYSAWQESAIMDELAHIPAGYGYVHSLDYRLNPEHPPLVKALAAAPLLLLQPAFPETDPAWTTAVNGQWDMGTSFLYHSGNDPERVIRTSRILPIVLTLLFILVTYLWARERLGPLWANLPAVLLALSPIVLAHGHYVTTDIGAALGIVLTAWSATRYLASPTRRNFWYAVLALGVAELMKFSAVLLLPYLAFLFLVHWLAHRPERTFWSYARDLVLMCAMAYLVVVYPVYFLFTAQYPIDKQASDTVAILSSYEGGPPEGGTVCRPARCLAELDIWMSRHALTRPIAQYLLGVIMVQQRATAGNTAYFVGDVSAAGSHWYFPVVYALKETLPALLFLLVGLWGGLSRLVDRARAAPWLQAFRTYLRSSFTEFAMLAFVVLYWAYSVKSPLNIGVRHILPTIPFMYLLAASAWRRWLMRFELRRDQGPLTMMKDAARAMGYATLKGAMLGAILLWVVIETALAAPHFLASFNEFGGGPTEGYRYVTDSNFDWGQDFLYLRELVNAHPEIDRIAVDYFGAANSAYYLGARAADWYSAKGDPRAQGIHWLAVSANNLQNAIQPKAAGYSRKPEDEYGWLTAMRASSPGLGGIPEPDYRAGTSIFVYHLP